MLADAAAEGDRIHAAEAGCHRPNSLQQLVAKDADGQLGAGVAGCRRFPQDSHVAAQPGEPQQPTLVV